MATLELTERQEKVLLVILARIGGHPETTLRGEIDPLFTTLRERHNAWYEQNSARFNRGTKKATHSRLRDLFAYPDTTCMIFAKGKDLPDAGRP